MKLVVISVISVISEFPERGVTGIVGNAYNGGSAIRTASAIRTEKIKINSMKNYTYGGFEKSSKHR